MARTLSLALLLVSLLFASTLAQTQYLIRHGEKPRDGGEGLSKKGKKRAKCLPNVFGPSSQYGIGYIMAETPKSNGERTRPVETVTPLASKLGLRVDTSCDRDDFDCVAEVVSTYQKENNTSVLICWEHGQLTDIAGALGLSDPPKYPDDHFNLIWTITDAQFVSTTSEDCPGLDPDANNYVFVHQT